MFALLTFVFLTDSVAQNLPTCTAGDTTLADDLGTFLDDKGRAFIGCRPSPGECQSSCPEQNGQAERDESICPSGGYGGDYACWCPTDPPEIPDLGPLPDNAMFVGCRPSAGECASSCDTNGVRWIQDPAICDPADPFSVNGGGACYCL